MDAVLLRAVFVWILLHIILFFVEWYRYKHSNLSWFGFKNNGMFFLTQFVWVIDAFMLVVGIIVCVMYWVFLPIL